MIDPDVRALVEQLVATAIKESPGDATYIKPGVVTARNANGTYRITMSGAPIPDDVLAYRNVFAPVGAVVEVLMVGNTPRIVGVLGQPLPQPQWFTDLIGGGTPTPNTYAEFAVHTSLLTVPVDCTMEVDVEMYHGFTGANNQITMQIRDQGGAAIGSDWIVNQTAGQYVSSAMRATKNYNAGQVAGFRIAYKVTTSNQWMTALSRVSFTPR